MNTSRRAFLKRAAGALGAVSVAATVPMVAVPTVEKLIEYLEGEPEEKKFGN